MREYRSRNQEELKFVKCNKCGKELKKGNDMVLEGVCQLKIKWDYFSDKDGEIHAFDLCEKCYDEFVKTFAIPLEIQEENELF